MCPFTSRETGGNSTLTIDTDNSNHPDIVVQPFEITGAFPGAVTYGAISGITVNGGSGNDALFYGDGSLSEVFPLFFNGGTGTNEIGIDNLFDPDSWAYTLSSAHHRRGRSDQPQHVFRQLLQRQRSGYHRCGHGRNLRNRAQLGSGFGVTINGEGGDDTLYMGNPPLQSPFAFSSVSATVVFDGDAGNDTVVANDASLTSARTYTVLAGGLSSDTGSAVIYDSSTENIELIGSSGGSTYNVLSTLAGTSTTLSGGSGNDMFNVTGAGAAFDIAGAMDLTGGGGTDSLSYTEAAYTGSAVSSILLAQTQIDSDDNAEDRFHGGFETLGHHSGQAGQRHLLHCRHVARHHGADDALLRQRQQQDDLSPSRTTPMA